jgi:excisionase family DNA binding protein
VDSYLTVNDVALFLKLSVQTIRRYTMLKEIPFVKINRAVRYKKSEIEAWVENRGAGKVQVQGENLQGGLFGGSGNGGQV